MTEQLTLTQLDNLARFERNDLPDHENIEYIAYLWHLLQQLDPSFASELKRDYEIYIQETSENV